MTITEPAPQLVGAPANGPMRLSHLAYVTFDTAATVDFYTGIMRMPLVQGVMHERVPSTGDKWPYNHIFFRMQDGSTLAFFEAVGLPPRAEQTHPAYEVFEHLALEVESTAVVDEWHQWLISQGIEVVGPTDHKIIYSIYFHDPNGIRLEITTPLVADWNDKPEDAQRIVDAWQEAKLTAAREGRPVDDVLREAIAAHDRRNQGH